MRRNDEDRLIELAFGEATPQEAEQLQLSVQSDPRLAETLRSYKEVRDGLSALREVPEMQLSCDRLRDAILAGGLREPRFGGWSWLAAPALVAAAFAVTLIVRRPTVPLPGGGVTVAQMEPGSSRVSLDPDLGTYQPVPFGKIEFREAAKSAPVTIEKPRAERASVASNSIERTKGLDRPSAANLDPIHPQKLSGSAEVGPASASAAPAMDKGAPEMQTAALIRIDPEKNGETGALKATEVESASNVVIGG